MFDVETKVLPTLSQQQFAESALTELSDLVSFNYNCPTYPQSKIEPKMSTFKILLFATTYSMTGYGSKHVNISLTPDRDFDVVIKIRNVQRLDSKVQYV